VSTSGGRRPSRCGAERRCGGGDIRRCRGRCTSARCRRGRCPCRSWRRGTGRRVAWSTRGRVCRSAGQRVRQSGGRSARRGRGRLYLERPDITCRSLRSADAALVDDHRCSDGVFAVGQRNEVDSDAVGRQRMRQRRPAVVLQWTEIGVVGGVEYEATRVGEDTVIPGSYSECESPAVSSGRIVRNDRVFERGQRITHAARAGLAVDSSTGLIPGLGCSESPIAGYRGIDQRRPRGNS